LELPVACLFEFGARSMPHFTELCQAHVASEWMVIA
jgi:hypothetical protein